MEMPVWRREYRKILRILWSAETVLENMNKRAMIGRPVYRIWLNKKFLWEFLMLASLPSVNR